MTVDLNPSINRSNFSRRDILELVSLGLKYPLFKGVENIISLTHPVFDTTREKEILDDFNKKHVSNETGEKLELKLKMVVPFTIYLGDAGIDLLLLPELEKDERIIEERLFIRLNGKWPELNRNRQSNEGPTFTVWSDINYFPILFYPSAEREEWELLTKKDNIQNIYFTPPQELSELFGVNPQDSVRFTTDLKNIPLRIKRGLGTPVRNNFYNSSEGIYA